MDSNAPFGDEDPMRTLLIVIAVQTVLGGIAIGAWIVYGLWHLFF